MPEIIQIPKEEKGLKHMKTKDLVLCAMFVALIAVGAFIKIPVPVVPFTLQFLFTMLAGLLLGPVNGALAVVVYILKAEKNIHMCLQVCCFTKTAI